MTRPESHGDALVPDNLGRAVSGVSGRLSTPSDVDPADLGPRRRPRSRPSPCGRRNRQPAEDPGAPRRPRRLRLLRLSGGDGRHDYRITASSHYGIGRDHPDYREGETCYRCRRCGDVFVALDSEMAALDEERWWDGD